MTQSALITERGGPPGLLFIGRGEYSMNQSALIAERGEPSGLLFIGIGEYPTAQSTPTTGGMDYYGVGYERYAHLWGRCDIM